MALRNGKWLVAAALVSGCAVETAPPVHQETQAQTLGESSQAYWFAGAGSGEMPTESERVAAHLLNRVRMAPYVWGIQDEDGNDVPPSPPLVYQPFFAEAGRWQGAHAIQYSCFCPQDPMAEPAAWNSCCELGYDDGQVKCVGGIVGCGDEGSTEQSDRWALLNRGPGQISSEFYWNGETDTPIIVPGEIGGAWVLQNVLSLILSSRDNAFGVSQVNEPVIPETCLPKDDPCEVGRCTDLTNNTNACDTETNPDCLGVCQGSGVADPAPPCILSAPIDPVACAPEALPQAFYWTFSTGRGSDPIPVLNDGIAFQLGLSVTDEAPNGTFGVTPEGEIEFSVHYYEQAGAPRSIQAVVRTQCVTMEPWQEQPVVPPADLDAGVDAGPTDPATPYVGVTYTAAIDGLPQGCQRYFFTTTNAEGFITRYPTHGSLGVSVDNAGNAVLGDENCPIWAPEIPAATCLAPADECNNGDTRPCYTGRDGTQGKGVCAVGTESCEDGRWHGVCEGEVRPALEEACGDSVDNNCNGLTDEDCPVVVEPNPTEDMGTGADAGTADMAGGDSGTTDVPKKDTSDDGGCTAAPSNESGTPWFAIPAFFGFALLMRRR